MTLRDDLNALTPSLRRYARALATGHPAASELADDVVHATLMRALGTRHVGTTHDLTIRLYATITQLHREVAVTGQQACAAGAGRPSLVPSEPSFPAMARQTKLSAALVSLPLEDREALLLVTLEGFDHTQASRILRISRSVLLARLGKARTALDDLLQMRPLTSPRARNTSHLRLVI